MPEHDPSQSTTATIAPELLLAAAIAEYTQVTRQTIANIRFLRRAIAAPVLIDTCAHVNRAGYECPEIAVVVNIQDDAGYCLAHHLKAEASRPGCEA